ncbi:unnamed protein product, partial [Rotaria sp. Silwood1]
GGKWKGFKSSNDGKFWVLLKLLL